MAFEQANEIVDAAEGIVTMIKIHNDGKGKQQSWEARLELDLMDLRSPDEVGLPPEGHIVLSAVGYGSHEEYAVQDLQRMMRSLEDHLRYRMDWNTRTRVAWDGKELKDGG